MRLWYLSHRRPVKAWAQSRQSLRCSPTWSMEVDEGSDQKLDIWPHWMAAHARLKNEFTEDEKYHNLMSCLICHLLFLSTFSANLNPFFFQKYPKIERKEWHWKEWHWIRWFPTLTWFLTYYSSKALTDLLSWIFLQVIECWWEFLILMVSYSMMKQWYTVYTI